MASTIKLKNGSGAPLASDLVQGEPALDLTNKRLYTEDSLGAVIEVGTNPTSLTTGDITATGTTTITTADINGGAIDGTTIGGTTTAAGSFTTLQADTSLNVDGTVTADGLTVDGDVTISDTSVLLDLMESDTTDVNTRFQQSGGDLLIRTLNDAKSAVTTRLAIDHATGDISFYEDTGTTAKFFWDASAESLGIGTTSPASLLHLESSEPVIRIKDSDGSAYHQIFAANNDLYIDADRGNSASSNLIFRNDNSEAMRIDSNGSLLLNTTSSAWGDANADNLIIRGSSAGLTISSASTGAGNIYFGDATTATKQGQIEYLHSFDSMLFSTNATEAMRIDSSGNLLVGKTTAGDVSINGCELSSSGFGSFSRDGNTPGYFNRDTSDGTIVDFRKDGAPVGSIGVDSSTRLYFTNSSGAGLFLSSGTQVEPMNNGSRADATMNIGGATYRFKDLYLSGGVYLGGTGSANHLDDYEEGTWTPTVTTGTVNAGNARYTKVGNLVTVMGNLTTFSDRTTAADIQIGGLPFTAASDNRTTGSVLCNYVNRGDAGFTAFISQSSSYISIYSITVNGNFDPVQHNHLSSSSTSIYFTISYRA